MHVYLTRWPIFKQKLPALMELKLKSNVIYKRYMTQHLTANEGGFDKFLETFFFE